jgi:hypothetical protein
MTNRPSALLGIVLSLALAGASIAANADDGDSTQRGGVLRCGGTSFLRQGGTEAQFTAWDLRNLSSTTSITVERVTFYAATGAVLFDSRVSGLPAFNAGVPLGPTNNVLGPNQTTGLTSLDVVGVGFLADLTQLPFQVEFVWSAPVRVPPLDVRTIRLSRQRDTVTGALLAERSRGDFNCISIG